MTGTSDPRLLQRLSLYASLAAMSAVAIGLAALIGWTLHIATLLTWGAAQAMAPNSAACMVLAGASLWFLRKSDNRLFHLAKSLAAKTAAALAGLVGLLSLAEHLFGVDFGIDPLLLVAPPTARTLMSPVTAGAFVLLALALLGIDWRTRRGDWPSQFLCAGAMLCATFGLIGLVLGASVSYITIALPTVVGFSALASGILCSRAGWAIGGLLASRSQGAKLLRGAIPTALLVLSVVGFSVSRPLLTRTHFTWVQVSLLAVCCSALLAGFITWMAFIVERGDRERRKVEEALHVGKEQWYRLLDHVEEPQSERQLRRTARWAFAAAIFLTGLLGLLSWHTAQQAAEDADWVAHTHEVSTTLEATLRHSVDVETGGRGFAETGSKPFLEPYESGRQALGPDLHALRLLVVDPEQSQLVNVLEGQSNAHVAGVETMVAARQNAGRVPLVEQFVRGKRLMDALRMTVERLEAGQKRLLEQRSQRARAVRQFTSSLIASGSLLGLVFLTLAGFSVVREIGVSAQARAQVTALNGDLERRVAERTAALEAEAAERAKIEAKLRASEEIFRMLLDGIKDYAVYMLDGAGRVASWNTGAARIKGYPAEEIVGKHFSCFYIEADRDRNRPAEALRDAAAAGRFEGEGWRVRKDGSKFWADAVITPLYEASGALRGYCKVVRDITERKRADDQLQKQAALLELAHDAIIVRDLESRVVFWNLGAQHLYGWCAGEVCGRVTHDLLQTTFPIPLADIEVELASKNDWEGELRHKTRSGTEVVVASRWSLQRDEHGAPAAILEINRDITDRKLAEAALGESEGRMAGIIASAMDAIITVDTEQRIVLFNCAAEKMFRCPGNEALGQPIRRFIPQRFHAGHAGHIRKFGENGVTSRAMGPKDMLWALRADGQEFQIEASISQVVTGGKKLFTVIVRDVTERVATEQAAREAQARMSGIVSSAMDAIITVDSRQRILVFNTAAVSIFGYSEAEALGQPLERLIPQWFRPAHAADIGHFGETGTTNRAMGQLDALWAVRSNGEEFQIEASISQVDVGGQNMFTVILRDVTERKQADEIRERLAAVVNSSDDAIIGKTPDGIITSWNRGSEKVFGYSASEAVGKPMLILLPPERINEESDILARIRRGESVEHLETVRIRKDGTRIDISATISPVRNSTGAIVGASKIARDITDRKLREEALRESEERFRFFIEHAPADLAMFDREMRYLHVSRRWRIEYGLGDGELRGLSHYDIFPDLPERWKQAHRRALAGEVLKGDDDRFDRADGSVKFIRWETRPWYGRMGEIGGIVIFTADVTERYRAEEALREKEHLLSESQRIAHLGSWTYRLADPTGPIAWSEELYRIYGVSADTFTPTVESLLTLILPADRSAMQRWIAACAAGERPADLEFRIVRPDGTLRFINGRGELQCDAEGRPVQIAGSAQDVTERKRAEAALQESETNFRGLVNLVPQIVWMCTNDGLNTYFNDRWGQYTGLTLEQSYGEGWNTAFHPDDKQKTWEAWNHATATGEIYRIESRLRAADDTYRWFLMLGAPLRDATGRIVRWFGSCTDIEEMKVTQAALRESEERFQAMANGIPQLAWMAEADGSIFWYNQRWYDYTGATIEQMQGWAWQSVHDPDMLPKVLERWKGAIAAGQPFDMEFPLRGADGNFRMFLTRVMPLMDAGGRVVRWFGTNTDISELKHAQERLAAQAESLTRQAQELVNSREALEKQTLLFRLVLDSMGEGLIAADQEGHFLLWNESATKLMARNPADLPSEQWTEHYQVYLSDGITPFPPDRLPLVRALRGESVQTELIIQHPGVADGVFLEVATRPMKDTDGKLCGGVAVLRDVTERKRAEAVLAAQAEELSRQAGELLASQAALETQKLMLQSVLDSMSEGLVTTDEQGKFIVWNPAAERIVGLGPANVSSEEWAEHYGLFLPDAVTPLPPERNPLRLALRGDASTADMFLRNSKVGTGIWIESSGSPLKDQAGVLRGGVVAFRDITRRKTDELEIRKLNDELEDRVLKRTAQLEASNHELEAFTYTVSHDLRAPLRHIAGFAGMCLDEFDATLDPQAQNYLRRIQDRARGMGELIDGLLNLSRMGRRSLQPHRTGLNSIAEEVVSMLQTETGEREVEWKIGSLPSVDCDPLLMKQVFQNLISNAIKYSRPRAHAVIEIGQIQENGEPVIFVRDNGVGFSMKHADKLFGVFQRLHRGEDFEGTGVGLATVRRIIEKHGGRVWAEAETDRGATFYFTVGSLADGGK